MPTGSKETLRHYGVRAKKSLGQHFLRDGRILAKIADAADPTPNDLVIEVGPGLGNLTRVLAKRVGQVIAVELDDRLASLLREQLTDLLNVHIVDGDIREMTPGYLLGRYSREKGSVQEVVEYKVVANLPYYVASPIIRHFLEASSKPKKMVVMVQKEVGEAIVAAPGSMGLLALAVQIYGEPHIVARVSAAKFYPTPKVDSVVVAIDVYPEPLVNNLEDFFRIARAGFSAPRKQMHNSLAHGLGIEPRDVHQALEKANVDGRRRPSTLTIEEWARLTGVLV